MNDKKRAALRKALAASFLVYLLPVFFPPHAMLLWGPTLVMELSRGSERGALWLIFDLTLAAALQAVTFLTFYWIFRAPNWRRVLVLIPAPLLLLAVLHWVYLIVIPTAFLVEADQSPEKDEWAEECAVPDYSVIEIPLAAHGVLAERAQAWVSRNADSQLAILKMPGCEIVPLNLKWSNADPLVHHATADGRAIYSTRDRGSNKQTLWFLSGPGEDPREIEQPPYTDYPRPVLSSDGQWVGWVQRVRESKNEPGVPQVLLQNLVTGDDKVVDLNHLTPASFELIALDMVSPMITLARSHREFLAADLNGETVWGPLRPDQVKASLYSFRKLKDGWVAWDGYKEQGAYMIQWDLPVGSGTHTILKGRGVTSLAVDPAGRYIAVSVGTNLRIGDIDDSVYVFRADDGREVFRRYQRPYTRSAVAFLGKEYFAYSEKETGEKRIRILRLPAL